MSHLAPHRDPAPSAALDALASEVRSKRMTTAEALQRAFLCGMNTAIHAQQDRQAHESGMFLARNGLVDVTRDM